VTLEFANVAFDAAGDEFEYVVGHREPFHLCLLAQDGDAGLQFWGLHVGDQPPLEPGPQPVFEGGELFGRAVRRDDDLLVGVVQRVEGVEELFLDTFFAFDELNVIDEEDVDVAVAALESNLAVVAERIDEVVGEFLGGDVLDPHAREQSLCVVAGGMQQVRLAETRLAPDEQGVVGTSGCFGDCQSSGMRKSIGGTDDERIEGIAPVETGSAGGS
jgi:hypothetical protein